MGKGYNEVEGQVRGQVWTIALARVGNLIERRVRGLVIPRIYEQVAFQVRIREHVTWYTRAIAGEIFNE